MLGAELQKRINQSVDPLGNRSVDPRHTNRCERPLFAARHRGAAPSIRFGLFGVPSPSPFAPRPLVSPLTYSRIPGSARRPPKPSSEASSPSAQGTPKSLRSCPEGLPFPLLFTELPGRKALSQTRRIAKGGRDVGAPDSPRATLAGRAVGRARSRTRQLRGAATRRASSLAARWVAPQKA